MLIARLMKNLRLGREESATLAADYDRFARLGLPEGLEGYVRERYRLDLSSEYGGLRIKNPFGKGAGQLSVNISQVRQDALAGLGFVVLKTIIAQDSSGAQSMSEWAVPETRMVVEPIRSSNGQTGWTVTWKGRGWYDSLDAYLKFYGESLDIGREHDMVVAPSCKYHLPGEGEEEWKVKEYEFTTNKLLDVWQAHGFAGDMPIEKDFSPTLAGSDRAAQMSTILRWLQTVTGLIERAARPRAINVGLKMFNAIFDDSFQLETLRAVNEHCQGDERPHFMTYANRLFDPGRDFDGVHGVAFGGPDLSARNLSVMGTLRALEQTGEIPIFRIPLSATGNIQSGRMAVEYLLRGACSFQIHTYFQLPGGEYHMQRSGKTGCALHDLYFHPTRGLVAWLLHLRRMMDWPDDWNIQQMAGFCADPANKLWIDYGPVIQ